VSLPRALPAGRFKPAATHLRPAPAGHRPLPRRLPGQRQDGGGWAEGTHEMRSRRWHNVGVGVLTFTNAAATVIWSRITQFAGALSTPHFVGTIDSWLHGYLLNPFAHLVTGFAGRDGDWSVRVVESSSSAPFLSRSHGQRAKQCEPTAPGRRTSQAWSAPERCLSGCSCARPARTSRGERPTRTPRRTRRGAGL
jgi:hypothetical protein